MYVGHGAVYKNMPNTSSCEFDKKIRVEIHLLASCVIHRPLVVHRVSLSIFLNIFFFCERYSSFLREERSQQQQQKMCTYTVARVSMPFLP